MKNLINRALVAEKKLLIVLLSVLSLTAFAQQKKVAVYVIASDLDPDVIEIVGSELANALNQENVLVASDQTAGLATSVSDNKNYAQICQSGLKMGFDYVCATYITRYSNTNFVAARLLDAKTGEIKAHPGEASQLATIADILTVTSVLADHIRSALGPDTNEQQLMQQQEAQYGPITNIVDTYDSYLLTITNEQKYAYIAYIDNTQLGVVQKNSTTTFRVGLNMYGTLKVLQRDGWFIDPKVYKFNIPAMEKGNIIRYLIPETKQ